MSKLEELKLDYSENRDHMVMEDLYSLIDLLWESETKLYSLLDELREEINAEVEHALRDKEDLD